MKTILKILSQSFFCLLTCMLFFRKIDLGNKMYLYGLLVSAVSWLFYGVREKITSFWIFMGTHLLGLSVAIFAIIQGGTWGSVGIMCLGIAIISIVIRYAPIDLEAPRYFHLLYFVVGYYFVTSYQTICLYMTIAYFLIVLLYHNLEEMSFYVATRSLNTTVDENELHRTNRSVSLVYIVLLGIVLVVVGVASNHQIWSYIGKMFRAIMRFIFRLFSRDNQNAVVEEEIVEEQEEILPQMIPQNEVQEAPQWAKIVSDILQYAFIIALIVLCIYVVIKLAIKLYHSFYDNPNGKEDSLIIEKITKIERGAGRKKKHELGRNDKGLNKIRKMYKRVLKKNGAKKLTTISMLVPEEQLNCLCAEQYDDRVLCEMRVIYEKARYSDEKITHDEILRFKQLYNERKEGQ